MYEICGVDDLLGFSRQFLIFRQPVCRYFPCGVCRKDSTKHRGTAPNVLEAKKVCPDPGFYQVRDKDVRGGLVDFEGNYVADERKLVGTQQ